MQIVTGTVVPTLATVLSPVCVRNDVQLLSPLTKSIHNFSTKEIHCETKARCIQALHYFAKPIDRLIQAVVAPIFLQINYMFFAKDLFDDKSYGWFTLSIVAAPVVVPVALVVGIIESIVLVANGLFQLVIPYQTIYAVVKGKEGAYEYFDYRKEISEPKYLFSKSCSVKVLTESAHRPPKKTLKKIVEENPRNKFVDNTFYLALIVDTFANTFFAALWLLHPSNLFPLSREIVVA